MSRESWIEAYLAFDAKIETLETTVDEATLREAQAQYRVARASMEQQWRESPQACLEAFAEIALDPGARLPGASERAWFFLAHWQWPERGKIGVLKADKASRMNDELLAILEEDLAEIPFNKQFEIHPFSQGRDAWNEKWLAAIRYGGPEPQKMIDGFERLGSTMAGQSIEYLENQSKYAFLLVDMFVSTPTLDSAPLLLAFLKGLRSRAFETTGDEAVSSTIARITILSSMLHRMHQQTAYFEAFLPIYEATKAFVKELKALSAQLKRDLSGSFLRRFLPGKKERSQAQLELQAELTKLDDFIRRSEEKLTRKRPF
jgi:hypothetical protein